MIRMLTLICLAALSVGAANSAAALDYPTGLWVNDEDGWVVETKPCDGTLCGYLVGFRATHPHPPGYVSRDGLNPDSSRRAAPLCGLRLIGGFTPSKRAKGDWDDGWIYDPVNGRTYSGTISMIDADTVRLRAYVGIPLFGRTIALHRETRVTTRCSAAPAG
jgi:uncharacterized protein (DUF2147 family)